MAVNERITNYLSISCTCVHERTRGTIKSNPRSPKVASWRVSMASTRGRYDREIHPGGPCHSHSTMIDWITDNWNDLNDRVRTTTRKQSVPVSLCNVKQDSGQRVTTKQTSHRALLFVINGGWVQKLLGYTRLLQGTKRSSREWLLERTCFHLTRESIILRGRVDTRPLTDEVIAISDHASGSFPLRWQRRNFIRWKHVPFLSTWKLSISIRASSSSFDLAPFNSL